MMMKLKFYWNSV